MRRLFDAQRCKMSLDGPLGLRNVLMQSDEGEAAYAAYFRTVDPYAAQATRDYAEARTYHIGRAKVGPELVTEQAFLKSEFYADFARRYDRRHMIGGIVGVGEAISIGVYRGEGASEFDELDSRLLQSLLPHLQRAIELRRRLARDEQVVSLAQAALNALPTGIAIVDAGLKIQFVNDVARKYLAGPNAGLYSIRSGPYAGSGVYIGAMSRDEASRLRRLVASATSGGSGGSMRVTSADGSAVVILVSPAPLALVEEVTGAEERSAEKLAMLVIRSLDRKAPPQTDMLCDLFSLSRAEAEVAVALSGGATAEDVARQRGVSLMTVRSQIRSILGKSEAENLRDFERSMATLAALVPLTR